MLRYVGLLFFVLAAGCVATMEEYRGAPDGSVPRPIRTYALDVSCEHCVKSRLETSIADMVRTSIPCAVRVPQGKPADLIFQYSEGDSDLCVDCEYDDDLQREWWWHIDLSGPPGINNLTLFGSVDKLFGRPARFARWHFRRYVNRQPWRCPP
jgi:hypothetical protein